MSLVILQPCGNQDAREHFRDTIENPVMLSDVSSLIAQEDIDELLKIYPNGELRVWGVTPGASGQNATKWDRMNPGDVTLLAQSGSIFASAVTTFKTHNKQLAEKLWHFDSKGQTWEYVYFLDEVKSLNIPYLDMNRAVGYRDTNVIQGFNVLDEEKSTNLMEAFDLESEVYLPNVDLDSVYSEIQNEDSLDSEVSGTTRKEQRALRRIHMKNLKTGTCSICGLELPVTLLVAAHIKKRSKCTLEEKKDLHNIATQMCVLGCDALYEKGFIGVRGGKVVCIQEATNSNAKAHVEMLAGESCTAWNEATRGYFDWHFDFHS
ncbi:hypothetical protein N9D63_08630 [Opitutales bacterium]|nr:hypothetical protein [Opitutales bacterium]